MGGWWGMEKGGRAGKLQALCSLSVPKGGWWLVFRSFFPPLLGGSSGLASAVAGREHN